MQDPDPPKGWRDYGETSADATLRRSERHRVRSVPTPRAVSSAAALPPLLAGAPELRQAVSASPRSAPAGGWCHPAGPAGRSASGEWPGSGCPPDVTFRIKRWRSRHDCPDPYSAPQVEAPSPQRRARTSAETILRKPHPDQSRGHRSPRRHQGENTYSTASHGQGIPRVGAGGGGSDALRELPKLAPPAYMLARCIYIYIYEKCLAGQWPRPPPRARAKRARPRPEQRGCHFGSHARPAPPGVELGPGWPIPPPNSPTQDRSAARCSGVEGYLSG